MIRFMQTVIVVTLSPCLATPAAAAPCPQEKSEFSRYFDDNGEGIQVVFSQAKADQRLNYEFAVNFDFKRKGRTVWSLGGKIVCGHMIPVCHLVLNRKPEFKDKVDPDAENLCLQQAIAVVDIEEREIPKYKVFGGISMITMGCGKFLDIKIHSTSDLDEIERDSQMFILPDYVKYQGCKP